jgi:hypothetical protein
MKKIIDFVKRLFGLSSSKPVEQINVVESTKKELQPISQVRVIKKHLVEHLSITKREAISLYRIYSLSKNIYKLRKRGMKIVYNQNTKIYTYEPKA